MFKNKIIKNKKNEFGHTADTPYGKGDDYGSAVKNKMGRSIDVTFVNDNNIKRKSKIPISLA